MRVITKSAGKKIVPLRPALSDTVSAINGDFGRKAQNFPTHMYFSPAQRRFPVEFCNGGGTQKLE